MDMVTTTLDESSSISPYCILIHHNLSENVFWVLCKVHHCLNGFHYDCNSLTVRKAASSCRIRRQTISPTIPPIFLVHFMFSAFFSNDTSPTKHHTHFFKTQFPCQISTRPCEYFFLYPEEDSPDPTSVLIFLYFIFGSLPQHG